MDFNIDEYKINNNKLYLNGWAHFDNYQIKVVSGEETKYIDHFFSRYDICMTFHEKIQDNSYGFKEELTFSKKLKKVKIYLIQHEKEVLLLNLDNRKVIIILKKVRKTLGKVKRGLGFLWKEYHFLVPPTMMKKYLGMVFKKKPNIELYNPEIISEYNIWLKKQSLSQDNETNKMTFISNHDYGNHSLVVTPKTNFGKAIAKVKTDYVCLIDGKVDLLPGFFSEINQLLNKEYDLIYFDNDMVINGTFCKPNLKPEWAPDTLLGVNYIGHCYVIKTSLLKQLAPSNFDLYALLLKLIDRQSNIFHLAKVLYHDYNELKNEQVLVKKYLKEHNLSATVVKNPDSISNTVVYQTGTKDLISIIIPTKDHADILEQCLISIYEKTTYKNYEIIVIDNNSEEAETFTLLKKYSKKKNFRFKRIECEFNYSYLNNEGSKLAKGEYLLLLNNDIEVITPQWLELMLGYAQRNHVGAVGAKLLFPDDTIQHAGIIMGKGGLAGHAYYGKKRQTISSLYELKIPYNVSACTAACLMFSKKKFEQVGGLEETLKVAFNDVDFNLKLKKEGYYNIFLPNVELYHYESKSRGLDTTSEKQKRFVQEWSFISEKWSKEIAHDPFYNDNYSKNEDYMLK